MQAVADAGDETHLFRDTMASVIDRIGAHRFCRIHRSRIVNVERVRELLMHQQLTRT